MKITKEEVLHVAKLARLNLSEQETEKLANDMEKIIVFADLLNELDTKDVIPTAHAIPLNNAFREDEIKPSFDRDELTKNAPHAEDGCYIVPKVVE